MRLLEIEALANGAHRNQTINKEIPVPEGWCVLPEDTVCENFPFGEVQAAVVDGVMTLVGWTPGVIPDLESEPAHGEETTVWEELDAAYRKGVDSV